MEKEEVGRLMIPPPTEDDEEGASSVTKRRDKLDAQKKREIV